MPKLTPIARAACALTLLGLGACEQAPIATLPTNDLRASEQVFAIFCRRLARESAPHDPDGLAFRPACEEGNGDALPSLASTGGLRALVARRPQILAALDRALGTGTSADALTAFAKADGDAGELDQFLYHLVPFYDQSIPGATRGLVQLAAGLSDEGDTQSGEILRQLVRTAARRGYRAPGDELSGVRAVAGYARLDRALGAVAGVLTDGAAGEAAFRAALSALSLELADPDDGIPGPPDWLDSLAELLFQAPPSDISGLSASSVGKSASIEPLAAAYTVVRGPDGAALGTGSSPFPVPGEADPDASARLPDGRLPTFQYRNVANTLLAGAAGAMRGLWTPGSDQRGALVDMASGIAPLLGEPVAQRYAFRSGRSVEATGYDLSTSPLLELVHAAATVLSLPETDALLAVLRAMLRDSESALAGLLHAALEVDRIADQHPEAVVSGWDGTPATRTEFWDDLIAYGNSLLDRPGMLEAVLRVYSRPGAVAQLDLLAKLMGYNDRVTYPGARIAREDIHSEADATRFNAPIAWQFASRVDRTKPDHGMNRSLFQRLLSTVAAVAGLSFCNKEGASMTVPDPTSEGGKLSFPNPAAQPGANFLLTQIVNLACAPVSPALSYKRCELVQHPNVAEAHIRTILGRLELKLKDPQLLCLMANGLAGDVGAQQEKLSQIKGYSLKPTAEAFTRFTYVAPNRFVSDISATQLTNDGVPLVDYEPDYSFVLEARQDDVLLDGQPASFMDVAKDIGTAFDDHELFEDTVNGKVATNGYRYVDLLRLFHMHWPSPSPVDCPSQVQPGGEGCTQRLDPARPFYSKQSNFVSYEPLLMQAEQEIGLGKLLVGALSGMGKVWVLRDPGGGAPRVVPEGTASAVDGLTVLSDFVRAMIAPSAQYAYRDGRTATRTNACVLDAAGGCKDGRGSVLPQTSPLYLVLDAVQGLDAAWERPAHRERRARWLAGRSRFVDAWLGVERRTGTDGAESYRLRDRRLHTSLRGALDWLADTVLTGRHPLSGDRRAWATGPSGLAARLAQTLGHPLVQPAVAVLEAVSAEPGAARELSRLFDALLDEGARPEPFRGLVLATADLLEYLRREPSLTPMATLLARALAPNVHAASAAAGPDPDVGTGVVLASTALLRDIGSLPAYADVQVSPMAKLLANFASRDARSQTALAALYDQTLEVNRAAPNPTVDKPLDVADVRTVLAGVQHFLSDPERGLERLYAVIARRDGSAAKGTP